LQYAVAHSCTDYSMYCRALIRLGSILSLQQCQLNVSLQLTALCTFHCCVYLQVPNVRALEDLIFDCIYAGLIQGKLDQRAGVLRVSGALARDVRLSDVDTMLQQLEQWAAAAQQAQNALQGGAADARMTRQHDEAAQR
jgi:hypothetical protein